jgi:mono/diheme cytochrome c family protein
MEFSNIGEDGDATHGNTIFADTCAVCHGADGTAFLVDGDEFTIGSFVRAKPNEAQHKLKFGQLGSDMGSMVTDLDDLLDLYKALSNSASTDPG